MSLTARITQEIQEAARTQARALSLADRGLTELPNVIGECVSLRKLYLQGNGLTRLPEEIGRCRHLQMLNLSSNRLTDIPEGVGNCTALETLFLSDNPLSRLPRQLKYLTSLSHLHLARCDLRVLPGGIGGLKKLEWLDLTGNRLQDMPERMSELSQLTALFLHANHWPPGLDTDLLGPTAEACQARKAQPVAPVMLLEHLSRRRRSPGGLDGGPVPLFVSYSHSCPVSLKGFHLMLARLKLGNLIAPWIDLSLTAGQEFHSEIIANLNAARIIVLLVSGEFMASEYIRKYELPRALELQADGDAVIVWVNLDGVLLNRQDHDAAALRKLQSGTRGTKGISQMENPEEGWRELEKSITAVVEDLRDSFWS